MSIRFGEHGKFHKAAAGMVGGSILFGAAMTPISPLAPIAGGVLGIGLGASIAYGKPARMILAGLATVPMLALGPTSVAFAASGALAALSLVAGGPRGVKGLLTLGLGALVTLVAMWCAVRITHAQKTMMWPLLAQNIAGAAAMGIVGVLSTLPRHLSLSSDPITTALRNLPANLDGEIRDLCNRAVKIWEGSADRLDAQNQTLLRDGVLKAIEVAAKSADVKITAGGDDDLTTRMAELDKRIEAATDDEVKTQYTAARAALDDQKRYREKIKQNRERLVARMHNHVAALEKFQLAATGLEASRVGSTSTAVKELTELSQNVATSGEALAEVELGATASESSPN